MLAPDSTKETSVNIVGSYCSDIFRLYKSPDYFLKQAAQNWSCFWGLGADDTDYFLTIFSVILYVCLNITDSETISSPHVFSICVFLVAMNLLQQIEVSEKKGKRESGGKGIVVVRCRAARSSHVAVLDAALRGRRAHSCWGQAPSTRAYLRAGTTTPTSALQLHHPLHSCSSRAPPAGTAASLPSPPSPQTNAAPPFLLPPPMAAIRHGTAGLPTIVVAGEVAQAAIVPCASWASSGSHVAMAAADPRGARGRR
jgi:hypothetical protein